MSVVNVRPGTASPAADTSNINAAIMYSQPGDTLVFSGTYSINAPIVLAPQRSYEGTGAALGSGAVIQQAAGTNLQGTPLGTNTTLSSGITAGAAKDLITFTTNGPMTGDLTGDIFSVLLNDISMSHLPEIVYVTSGAGTMSLAAIRTGSTFMHPTGTPVISLSPTGLFVASAWATDADGSDAAVRIRNLAFDGNVAGNPLSTACGIILANYWSWVEDCYVHDTPLHGVLYTDVTENGLKHFANGQCSENRLMRTRIQSVQGHGFRQQSATGQSNLDGFCSDNPVQAPWFNALRFDVAAGWLIDGNHTYGVGSDAISLYTVNQVAAGGYATRVVNNYIEDFGGLNKGGTYYYHGIRATVETSRGLHIVNNFIGCVEATPSNYQYVYLSVPANVTDAHVHIAGNLIHGPATSAGVGYVVSVGANATLAMSGDRGQATVNTPFNFGGTQVVVGSELGPVVSTTASYAARPGDTVLASGTVTITTPPTALNSTVTVVNTSTGPVTVIPASGQINGAASFALSTRYTRATFASDGANWYQTA